MRKAFAHIPRTTLLAGIMLMALASCKPKRPAGVLSPSQMENLLVGRNPIREAIKTGHA